MKNEKTVVNLNPKKISTAVNQAVSTGFQANMDGDTDFLQKSNHNWDDLIKLKEELAKNILEFTMTVADMAKNTSILANLGPKLKDFLATVELFFKDMNTFSERVKGIRLQHEHLSGPITDMDSYNLYNRLAFEYHSLCNELAILVTPTMSQLILITSEAVDNSKAAETPVTIEGSQV